MTAMVAFTSMERDGNESDKDRLFIAVLATGEKKYLTKDFDYNAGNVTWDGNDKLWFLSPIRATYQLCKVRDRTVRRWRWSPAARTT